MAKDGQIGVMKAPQIKSTHDVFKELHGMADEDGLVTKTLWFRWLVRARVSDLVKHEVWG